MQILYALDESQDRSRRIWEFLIQKMIFSQAEAFLRTISRQAAVGESHLAGKSGRKKVGEVARQEEELEEKEERMDFSNVEFMERRREGTPTCQNKKIKLRIVRRGREPPHDRW